jgi:hypothetical protein
VACPRHIVEPAGPSADSISQNGEAVLTAEKYLARKWRSLPVLRLALDRKAMPHSEWRTGKDDTFGVRLEQLLDIASLTLEHRSAVRDSAQADNMAAVHTEIEWLAKELASCASYVEQVARRIADMHEFIEQP